MLRHQAPHPVVLPQLLLVALPFAHQLLHHGQQSMKGRHHLLEGLDDFAIGVVEQLDGLEFADCLVEGLEFGVVDGYGGRVGLGLGLLRGAGLGDVAQDVAHVVSIL